MKKEQQAVISFCIQLKKQLAEMYALLQQAHGAQCLSRPMVKRWHKLYSEGRTKAGAVPRGLTKKKKTVATEVNVNSVTTAIQEDCHLFDSKIRVNAQHSK